jgi:hypothetical protein
LAKQVVPLIYEINDNTIYMDEKNFGSKENILDE